MKLNVLFYNRYFHNTETNKKRFSASEAFFAEAVKPQRAG
ncbi:MAG: hypothetical protein ACJAYR_001116 [Sneathiella sp.]|jgi:hypothetical protein